MASLLLVTLAVLVPVSAATPVLELSHINTNGNGATARIVTSELVITQGGILSIDIDVMNTLGVDYTVEVIVTGDGIDNTKTETLDIPANLGSIAETVTAEFVLDNVLPTGTHNINVQLNLNDMVQTQDTGSLAMDLTVNPVIETIHEEGLITADLDEDTLNPGDTVELTVELDNDGHIDSNGVRVENNYDNVNVEFRLLDSNNERVGDTIADWNVDGTLEYDSDEEKSITIELPSDLDTGVYTVEIVAIGDYSPNQDTTYRGLQLDTASVTFDVEKHEDSLIIESVQHNSNAEAGDTYSVAVTVMNNGENYQDNVIITVSMAGATVTSSSFEIDQDDEVVQYFNLNVPSDAQNTEVLIVLVTGEDTSARYTAEVTVGASTTVSSAGLSATVDSVSKTVGSEGTAYMITLANNDDSTRTVAVSVGGVQGWADATITPSTLTLAPGSSGVVSVYINPTSSAEGTNAFTVYVSEGNQVISSVGLTATIDDALNAMSMILAAIALVIVGIAYQQRARPTRRRASKKSKRVYY